MPSWNAIDLGPFVRMRTRANRVELQLTAYPGVNGVGGLNMGSRGFTTEATIGCVGTDFAALSSVITTFMSAQVGAVRGTLIDSLGNSWPDTMIAEFYPTEDPIWTPGFGWVQEYHVEFFHFD